MNSVKNDMDQEIIKLKNENQSQKQQDKSRNGNKDILQVYKTENQSYNKYYKYANYLSTQRELKIKNQNTIFQNH